METAMLVYKNAVRNAIILQCIFNEKRIPVQWCILDFIFHVLNSNASENS